MARMPTTIHITRRRTAVLAFKRARERGLPMWVCAYFSIRCFKPITVRVTAKRASA